MKPFLRLILAGALAATLAPSAHALDRAAVAAARRDLQAAVDGGDLAAMMSVRARLAALAEAEPKEALLHYWVAVASWRALPLQKDDDLAERMGDAAIEHLDRALEIDPRFAEALAVKGGVQGMLIRYKSGAMMTLGPQSGANISRAMSMQPDNPRIHLFMGVGDLHKPAVFGGGPKGAIEEFRRAQELFAKESVSDSVAPDWGHDDAYAWEGRAWMKRKDYAAARAAYLKALEINPSNGWVLRRLLPQADQALAAKEK